MTSEPPDIELSKPLCGGTEPVTSYGLQAPNSRWLKLQSSSDWFWENTSRTPKAADLSARALEIQGLDITARYNIGGSTFVPQEKRDWGTVWGP